MDEPHVQCQAEIPGQEDHYVLRCELEAGHDGMHMAGDPPPGVYLFGLGGRETVGWREKEPTENTEEA